MVQTEVAQRMSAKPGAKNLRRPIGEGRLVRRCTSGGGNLRHVFWPVPNVDSSLVQNTRYASSTSDSDGRALANSGPGAQGADGQASDTTLIQGPDTAGVSRQLLFEVVDVAFAQRRKTLRAALKKWAGGAEHAEALLLQAGIDPSRRGET